MLSLNQLSDQQLVEKFENGNNAAITELLTRYKGRIYSSIYFLVKDKFLAEDIFQETFIKVIDTIRNGKYTEEGKFLSWVIRIAHNICIDHFRKVKRNPTIKTSEGHDIFEVLQFEEDSPEVRMCKQESTALVQKLIEQLPYDQKEILILRLYANLNFKEIATLTQCSINTALSRMRYSLINLRKMIDEKQIVF